MKIYCFSEFNLVLDKNIYTNEIHRIITQIGTDLADKKRILISVNRYDLIELVLNLNRLGSLNPKQIPVYSNPDYLCYNINQLNHFKSAF